MEIVCFDTNILIWGIKGEATPGQEEMISKAKNLIKNCQDEKKTIIIPSVVVAEVLPSLDPRDYNDFITLLKKNFIVPPFDTQAAAQFARMWRSNKGIRQEVMNQGVTRDEIKADCLILAIAVARGGWCIYTHDGPMKTFAQNYIEVRGLPDVPNTPIQEPLGI